MCGPRAMCGVVAPTKLRDWLDPANIVWKQFSGNTHYYAIQMLEENPENIDWWYLSGNPCAIHLLEKNIDRIDWNQMSYNYRAMQLVEQYPDKIDYWTYVSGISCMKKDLICIIEEHLDSVAELVKMVTAINTERMRTHPFVPLLFVPRDNLNWSFLSFNSHAIHILEQHPEKIDWSHFSLNSHPRAIRMLEQHPENIDWSMLSRNSSPDAIRLLEQHPEKIDWWYLSTNTGAKRLLEQYPEKIDWSRLCQNKSEWAMQWLQTRPDKICWIYLSQNPYIFEFNDTYNYEEMKQSKLSLHEDLIRRMLHPDNLCKFAGWGIECGFDHEEADSIE